MSPLFESTVEAVEEAIVNALVAAEPMTGRDDHAIDALPISRVREILKNHQRLRPADTPLPEKKAAE